MSHNMALIMLFIVPFQLKQLGLCSLSAFHSIKPIVVLFVTYIQTSFYQQTTRD